MKALSDEDYGYIVGKLEVISNILYTDNNTKMLFNDLDTVLDKLKRAEEKEWAVRTA